jgi:hypothetical protein
MHQRGHKQRAGGSRWRGFLRLSHFEPSPRWLSIFFESKLRHLAISASRVIPYGSRVVVDELDGVFSFTDHRERVDWDL